jgi:hypothetical protein
MSCSDTVLHGWLEEGLTAVHAAKPTPPAMTGTPPGRTRKDWERWQET